MARWYTNKLVKKSRETLTIVAAAQIRSTPGDVSANIELHLAAIKLAVHNSAVMVVFPKLSLTGYEPSLADQLAFELLDDRLQIFGDLSANLGITIGIGIPTKTNGKPRISHAFSGPTLRTSSIRNNSYTSQKQPLAS